MYKNREIKYLENSARNRSNFIVSRYGPPLPLSVSCTPFEPTSVGLSELFLAPTGELADDEPGKNNLWHILTIPIFQLCCPAKILHECHVAS